MQTEKTDMKAYLFQTAVQLFRERGYENVSVKEICNCAGVTRNAFYYHYDSKEGLLGSYLENSASFQEKLFTELIELPNDFDKLLHLFESHMKAFKAEGVSLTRQLLKINIDQKANMLNTYILTDKLCIPMIRRCKEEGLIKLELEPERLNYYATRLCMGILMDWCACDGGFDLIKRVRDSLTNLLSPGCY